jgi:hypothetical protein
MNRYAQVLTESALAYTGQASAAAKWAKCPLRRSSDDWRSGPGWSQGVQTRTASVRPAVLRVLPIEPSAVHR